MLGTLQMSEKTKARIERPGPKRILTLSGGGTRGIITIAFLEEIERILKDRSSKGDEFRLSDYYDLISGTSVGSMLASVLALLCTWIYCSRSQRKI